MIVKELIKYYLVYSPDDGGYYWSTDNKTSITYPTLQEAEKAEKNGAIIWETN